MDVPDMDGVVWIENNGNLKYGEFVNCKIIETEEYDLKAVALQ